MKKVKRREKEEEISEEQEWYRMKMARYYEEEFDNLFKTKSKHAQKIILHEPDNRIAKQFAKDLIADLSIGISFWDERLSTVAVERVLIQEANLSRYRRSQIVDKVAAVYILQSALDYLSTN